MMKKRFIAGFSALMIALSASVFAADAAPQKTVETDAEKAVVTRNVIRVDKTTLNLIPDNALGAGFINLDVITKGPLFVEILKAIELDWDKFLAENQCKREDLESCVTMYFSIDETTLQKSGDTPAFEFGGAAVYSRNIRKEFSEAADKISTELKKKENVQQLALKGINVEGSSVESLKIDGKEAFLLSIPKQNISVVAACVSDDMIQFRVFVGKAPVRALIPILGEVNPMTELLDTHAGISFVVSGTKLRAMIPVQKDAQGNVKEDPTLKSIRNISFSTKETEKTLDVIIKADTDVEGVKLIQAQAQEIVNSMKQNPMTSVFASATKIFVEDTTTVVVRIPIPKQVLVSQIQSYYVMQKAQQEIQAAQAAEQQNAAKKQSAQPNAAKQTK